MKKIKQFSLKAMLLTIAAALTIGFTGCSDELSGDQTQGKPGYLTVNLRTLKTKQTKFTGDNVLDYQTVKDFNVFVVDGNNILFSKFTTTNAAGNPLVSGTDATSVSNDVSLQVGNLPEAAKVVVIANWGTRITGITTLTALKALTVTTVKAFDPTKGLVMTGQGSIATTASGLSYTSAVTVSPVSSKITVKWNTTAGSDVAQYFTIDSIFIVNAVRQTTLPIVGGTTITDLIVPNPKLVSSGFNYTGLGTTTTPIDYDLYALNLDAANLTTANPTAGALHHFYVGENYHKAIPTTAGDGAIYTEALTNSSNANTLILIKAMPTPAGEAIYGTGARYYTYALSNAIANNAAITDVATTGFSTKRKTNYIVNFTLDNAGTTNPFVQVRTLTVTVTASGWDDIGTTPTF